MNLDESPDNQDSKLNFIQLELLGSQFKPNNDQLNLAKYLMISKSSIYIIRDIPVNSELSENLVYLSKQSLEESNLILDELEFKNIAKISFAAFEKCLEKNYFPMKIILKNSSQCFFELKKDGFLYLRKIFMVILDNSSKKSVKHLKYVQNIKDRLTNLDCSKFLKKLFLLIVVEDELIKEDQFQRLIFDIPELDILVSHRNASRQGGFKFLSDRVQERIKKKSFKIDYFVPDLWKNSSKMLTIEEENQDLLHIVEVPQLDKVNICL
jgi:hypothetical protein